MHAVETTEDDSPPEVLSSSLIIPKMRLGHSTTYLQALEEANGQGRMRVR